MRLEGIIDMTRCLLVDEDQEERQVLSELLGQYGFDMAETASAEAALKVLSSMTSSVMMKDCWHCIHRSKEGQSG